MWEAQFVSNVGGWMQTAAAQWLMLTLTSSAVYVTLVQSGKRGGTNGLPSYARHSAEREHIGREHVGRRARYVPDRSASKALCLQTRG
jgi:hypothetical protein